MKNDASSTMPHNIDLHAVTGPGGGAKVSLTLPGKESVFTFSAMNPGLFVYHCAMSPVPMHIANGMYGMILVEPKEGLPKVDKEFYVMQSEFYTKVDPEQRKVDGQSLYVLDGDRLRGKQPTYTVFNGAHNKMVKQPLPAKPGERVRLFVLNVGPSNTSSFHVVGTIFDRVWIDGNPENQFRGMQTVLLGSSNAAIVEFLVPESGSYIMVDHHFANASQGAIGLIDASSGKAKEGELEHHNLAATATPSDPDAVKGKLAFESKCLACHSIGQGPKLGPDLAGVTKRRDDDWLARWLKSPDKMLASDETAKSLLKEYKNIPMPNQNLDDGSTRTRPRRRRRNEARAASRRDRADLGAGVRLRLLHRGQDRRRVRPRAGRADGGPGARDRVPRLRADEDRRRRRHELDTSRDRRRSRRRSRRRAGGGGVRGAFGRVRPEAGVARQARRRGRPPIGSPRRRNHRARVR